MRPLYGDASIPYDCSQLFIAINVAHFRNRDGFATGAESAAQRIRDGARAPGVTQLFTPGEPEWRRANAAQEKLRLDPAVAAMLQRMAASFGVDAPSF